MSAVQPRIEHQERDFALLEDLFVSRVMTLSHVAAIRFGGRPEAAKKRVQKLKAAGLIAERPRRARDPGILFLSKRGYELLKQNGHVAGYPGLSAPAFEKRAKVSDLTLRHELGVMDAKAALLPAINRTPGMSVIEFTTWPMLHQFDVRLRGHSALRVKPDGFLLVEEKGVGGESYEHTFFLEVDRGTEILDTLANRALCYREHYRTGGYAASCGASRNAFAEYPFRVLIVFPSEERRNNMAERLLSLTPPIETLVWLTTAAELRSDPLGPVWVRPRDYAQALKPTVFGTATLKRTEAYRRHSRREAHVRGTIVRHSLLSN